MRALFVTEVGRHYAEMVEQLRHTDQVDHISIAPRWKVQEGNYHIPKIFGRHIGYRILTSLVAHYLLFRNNYDYCITDCCSVSRPAIFMVCKALKTFKKTKFIHDLRTIPVEHGEKWDGIIKEQFDRQLRFANKGYDGITMITEEMRKHIEERYLRFDIPIGIWESAVNTELFRPLPKNMGLRRKLGYKDDDFLCFYHGTMTDKRGIFELCESLSIIKVGEGKIKLLFLGDGNSINKLEALINRLNLMSKVRIHEWVEYPRVPDFISIADLCIVPLPDIDWWRVSSPLKLLDYIACGKNIAMTEMAAHMNVVGQNSKYFFFRDVSARSIAEKIEEVYECFIEDPQGYLKNGIEERERLIGNLSYPRRAEALKRFLRGLKSA